MAQPKTMPNLVGGMRSFALNHRNEGIELTESHARNLNNKLYDVHLVQEPFKLILSLNTALQLIRLTTGMVGTGRFKLCLWRV